MGSLWSMLAFAAALAGCHGSGSGAAAGSGTFVGHTLGVVTLVPSSVTLVVGQRFTFEVSAFDGAGHPAPPPGIVSRDPGIASLSGKTVTAKAAGFAALETGDKRVVGFVNVVSAGAAVDATTPATISLGPPVLDVVVDGTAAFTARVFSASGAELDATSLGWAVDDATVATISSGVVTGVGNGVARVTAAAGAVTATAVVVVSNPAQPGGTAPSGMPVNCVPGNFVAANIVSPPSPMALELWPDGTTFTPLTVSVYSCPNEVLTTNEGRWSKLDDAPGVKVDAKTGTVSATGCGSTGIRWEPKGSSPSATYLFKLHVRPKWGGAWTCTGSDSCGSVYSGVIKANVENPRFVPATMPVSERGGEYTIESMARRDFASGDGCGCFEQCCTSLPGSLAPGSKWTVGTSNKCTLDTVDDTFTCTRGGGGMCPASMPSTPDAGMGDGGGAGTTCGKVSVFTDVPCDFWAGVCTDLPVLGACCKRGGLDAAITDCQKAYDACIGNELTETCNGRFAGCLDAKCPGGSAEIQF